MTEEHCPHNGAPCPHDEYGMRLHVSIPGHLSCEYEDSFEMLTYDNWRYNRNIWHDLGWRWKIMTWLLYTYKFHEIRACKTGRVRHEACQS